MNGAKWAVRKETGKYAETGFWRAAENGLSQRQGQLVAALMLAVAADRGMASAVFADLRAIALAVGNGTATGAVCALLGS